jgi:DNA repair protein RecO (recombination protein O)
MPEFRDTVLVLRHRVYRDHDALLVGFGREQGKFSAVARGVRSSRSHLAAGVQPLTLTEMTVFQGRSTLYTVTSADAVRHYPRIRQTLERTARAAMLADMLDELWSEHDAAPPAFQLVVEAFSALEEGRPPAAVFLAGFWQLMRQAGFAPDFSLCSVCGASMADAQEAGFRTSAGPVCSRCRGPEDTDLSAAALSWLRRAGTLSGERLGTLVGSRSVMDGLERQARDYLLYHLGRMPRAFRFWEQVSEPIFRIDVPHVPDVEEGDPS